MNFNNYSPGMHKLVTLRVQENKKLIDSMGFIEITNQILEKFSLEKVGAVVHNFENKSFTISVCLKESHICIHTWPEFQQLTLDVYLCNYMKDNSEIVKEIVRDYIYYFNGDVLKDFEINR
jgi:S-adenosylmethionine decarboxylase